MTSPPLLALLCASVLLQSCSVMAAAGPTITIAFSKQISMNGDMETREQGPTAWICSALDSKKPHVAYADIRGYLEGGNLMEKNYNDVILYPVMELTHETQSKLCVFLPSEDHCYPPTPTSTSIVVVKQFKPRNYYDIRFWGQASDARVEHYHKKLTSALQSKSVEADLTIRFLSYFPDHIREVRFDAKAA